ncbi:2,3-diaminopropionate biosynthesis protein SbnA [Aliivibrio fischeri]|uniref:2,3-diaminopropionate biosynthesis protein SbnA n=1 Tax=Aliivibrio fischeri TaxID=668 RepID=UPI0012D909DE|nr:2,3-diaminopropionate biosynthesis protein SbnA [Aliivibrio fischeri]MUK29130.1 2,3-diaminopropionate biosynthesis protein SbnA [Aliivibrio fischeri]
MIFNTLTDLVFDDIFLKCSDVLKGSNLFLKLEGFSIGGSIKIKPALKMINRLEVSGVITPLSTVIESSSGNLGVALSIICASKGYPFTCVADPNISEISEKLIKAYGGNVIKVQDKDSNGGYLTSRINRIRDMCKENPLLVWTNQYENIDNIEAHYLSTGASIIEQFPEIDYLFIGAGTTGTLCGVSKHLYQHNPKIKIIAVDSVGSVTFDGNAGKRVIPGLGASKVPPISKLAQYDELIRIDESETVNMCLKMAKKGLMLGGSSGTVLAAIDRYKEQIPEGSTVVVISPDFGERYLNSIYDEEWNARNFSSLVQVNYKKLFN